jgi:hypothetical protein
MSIGVQGLIGIFTPAKLKTKDLIPAEDGSVSEDAPSQEAPNSGEPTPAPVRNN